MALDKSHLCRGPPRTLEDVLIYLGHRQAGDCRADVVPSKLLVGLPAHSSLVFCAAQMSAYIHPAPPHLPPPQTCWEGIMRHLGRRASKVRGEMVSMEQDTEVHPAQQASRHIYVGFF